MLHDPINHPWNGAAPCCWISRFSVAILRPPENEGLPLSVLLVGFLSSVREKHMLGFLVSLCTAQLSCKQNGKWECLGAFPSQSPSVHPAADSSPSSLLPKTQGLQPATAPKRALCSRAQDLFLTCLQQTSMAVTDVKILLDIQ